MQIAVISSNEQVSPPPEDVIIASQYISTLIAEGLYKRGHILYSIVGQGSRIKTKKIFSNTKPFFNVISKPEWENIRDIRLMWQLMVPFEMDLNLTLLNFLKTTSIDIIHFNSIIPYYGLPFALQTNLPCVFTLHGRTTPTELKVIKAFQANNIHFVSISHSQRQDYPGLPFAATIYNGIPTNEFKFNPIGGKPLSIAGRLKKEKGFEQAIEVSKTTGHNLKIAGDIRVSQKEYFSNILKPLIDQNPDHVQFVHLIKHDQIDSFFGTSKLFLSPISWEEPFGLVMIESMASGTPVVAYARGSVPEIIKDGETGFIVNPSDQDIRGNWIIKETGIGGLRKAVEKIYSMPETDYHMLRLRCREHVQENFSVKKMVDSYETLYQRILPNQ